MKKENLLIHTLKRRELLGLLREFRADPLITLMDLQRRYGDLIYCPFPVNTLIVLDPYLLKELFSDKTNIVKGSQAGKLKPLVGNGLFSTEGSMWKNQRRTLAPLFHNRHISQHAPTIQSMANEHILGWAKKGKINLTKEITEMTFNISGTILFGGIPEVDLSKLREAVEISGEVIFNKISALFPTPYWIPTRDNRRFLEARKTLDTISDQLIVKARNSKNVEAHDLLSMMLKAGISDNNELRDQIKTMMIAGHDTTSTFIIWTLMSILYDQEIYQNLKKELRSDPHYADHQNFRNILNESLRLFPPSAIISRMNTAPITLGVNAISAGTNIITSQYVLGRDERIWKDANIFNPDRFNSIDLQEDLFKYSFFPFSLGARRCVGETMAYLEVSLIIAEILKNYDLQPLDQADYSKESVCDLIFKPKNDFICNVSPVKPIMQ
jgi:cytochrome P450